MKVWLAAGVAAVAVCVVAPAFGYVGPSTVPAASGRAHASNGSPEAAKKQGRKPKLTAGASFSLPPAGRCISGRKLTFQLRKLSGVKWRTAVVVVNGKHFRTITGARLNRLVQLTGLPRRTFVLSITATTTDGRRVTAKRTYHPCPAKSPARGLSVVLAGSGSGTVTGTGIACPGTCSHSYAAGTVVTLTAASASGSSFSGWSGGGCSGTATCAVTLSSDQNVTATFAVIPPHSLSVVLAGSGSGTVTGTGIACPGTCSHSYAAGTVVTLTAASASGSSFSGWSGGGCSGTATCAVTLSSDQNVTATFAVIPPHSLSVVLAGSGSGTVTGTGIACPGTCSHSYAAGTVVTLTAASASGSSFSGWSGGGCSGTATCTVTLSSDQNVTATFATNTGPAPPGSYSGSSVFGTRAVGFYVSADGSHIQDVAFDAVPACTPAKSFAVNQPYFGSIAINLDGSFSATATEDGVAFNTPAHFTYTFSGQFVGPTAAGQLREDITFNDGTAYSCTTNTLPWAATRDIQGDQTASAPPAGSYSGSSVFGTRAVGFYVSADGSHIQDVVFDAVPACTPAKSFAVNQPHFGSIAINQDGSFSATATEDGLAFNTPAQFTYTLTGHLHGKSANGTERVGGQLREDITFNDGTAYSCTTNTLPWAATRDIQGDQTASAPPAGSYSGSSVFGTRAVGFYVSADGSHIQDVVFDAVPACTPAKSFAVNQPHFGSIAINLDGSFSATATEDGLAFNTPAQFTYTLTGHLHGKSANGTERVGGQLREDITFNDGTAYSCTTNTLPWAATRDIQGDQTASAPPAGSYSGSSVFGTRAVGFYVSADGSHIQDVVFDAVPACTPAKSFAVNQPHFGSIAINLDGSFSATATEDGLAFNTPAQFTYTLTGHLHGKSANGTERVGGQLREDITFNDGTAYSCTTNTLPWAATRDIQGDQTASAPPAGSYSGSSVFGTRAVGFYVSADGSHIQDVVFDAVPACTPAKSFAVNQPHFGSIAINLDGSFSATATEDGLAFNTPAQFTYTLTGHLHGKSANGTERVGGQLREDITFNDGTAYSCTTNTLPWAATRDIQGDQTASAPPAGSYSGSSVFGTRAVGFTVAPGGTQLQNVTAATAPTCTPSKSFPADQLHFASIAINADGSFSATTSQAGTVFGLAAQFTYTFNGHFHGKASNGTERVGGQLREDVTFNDGTAYSCTTNTLPWSALGP